MTAARVVAIVIVARAVATVIVARAIAETRGTPKRQIP